MNRLTTLYKNIITAVGGSVNKDNTVTAHYGDVEFPMQVSDKQLILPVDKVLRNPDWEQYIAFHPLCESIARGESPVLKVLRKMTLMHVYEVVSVLATQLMDIAADRKRHKGLSPIQNEFLSHLPDADEKMKGALKKVLESTSVEGQNRLISLYLKRGGKHKDTKFSRLAVFSMPIMDVEEGAKEIYGAKIRVRDVKSILALFEYILPGGNDGTYNQGSQSKTAPYLHAMMLTFIHVAKQLNSIVKLFEDQLEGAANLMINVDWESELGCLADMVDLIPALNGNQGSLRPGEKEEPAAAAPVTAAPVTSPVSTKGQIPVKSSQAPATPVQTTTQASSGGAVTWGSVSQATHRPPQNMAPQGGYPVGQMPVQAAWGQHPNHPYGFSQSNQPMQTPHVGSNVGGMGFSHTPSRV